MRTGNQLPSVGDWITIDKDGHIGEVLAVQEEVVEGKPLGSSIFIGVNDQGVEKIDLPYYSRVTPKSVESMLNLAGVGSEFHTVFLVHSYELVEDEKQHPRFRIGAVIPIHENGRESRILNIMGNYLFVEANIGELSARLHDAAQYIKDDTLGIMKYTARIPMDIYNAWYDELFTFRKGMRVRIGHRESDLAEVLDVRFMNKYEVEVVLGVISGSIAPMLVWAAHNWSKETRMIKIRAILLNEWLQSVIPDTLPEITESSTTFTGYSRLVPVIGRCEATTSLRKAVHSLGQCMRSDTPMPGTKQALGDALYCLTQLVNAYGLNLQDIATQSLTDRTV